MKNIIHSIANVTPTTFEEVALEVFHYQAEHCPVYKTYMGYLGVSPGEVKGISSIPFLPVSVFKTHLIKSGQWQPETVFRSSGTTGAETSAHLVRSLDFYTQNTLLGFSQQYGDPADFAILALLPSYLERQGSSLVYMAQQFIQRSRYPQSGFFLGNTQELAKTLLDCTQQGIPTLLLGVSFALLDLAEQFPMDLSSIIIMETGGMKGRRKELTRMELHEQLQQAFQTKNIHSEYGMTELLSQAYAPSEGLFWPAPTLRAFARDPYDPPTLLPAGRNGGLNLIDLANIDTCSFIAVDDIGRVYDNGSFEVLGRFDASDVRGCNLLMG